MGITSLLNYLFVYDTILFLVKLCSKQIIKPKQTMGNESAKMEKFQNEIFNLKFRSKQFQKMSAKFEVKLHCNQYDVIAFIC